MKKLLILCFLLCILVLPLTVKAESKLTLDPITTDSYDIDGKTIGKATVFITQNKKTYQTKSRSNGTFSYPLYTSKKGSVITIKVLRKNKKYASRKVIVKKASFQTINLDLVNQLEPNSSSFQVCSYIGNYFYPSMEGNELYIQINETVYHKKYTRSTSFTLSNKLKVGDSVSAWFQIGDKKIGYQTGEVYPSKPVISFVGKGQTFVSGQGSSSSWDKIIVYVNHKKYVTYADEFGLFYVDLNQPLQESDKIKIMAVSYHGKKSSFSRATVTNKKGVSIERKNDISERVLYYINQERVNRGLTELPYKKTAEYRADIQAMVTAKSNDYLPYHMSGQIGLYTHSFKGDNADIIAKRIVKLWMDSDSHRESILATNFDGCAIVVYQTTFGLYATAAFDSENTRLLYQKLVTEGKWDVEVKWNEEKNDYEYRTVAYDPTGKNGVRNLY